MATEQLIDLSNFSTLLVQSTQGRSGAPDGNIFFDVANGRVELITSSELANVDLGSGSESNPLSNEDGIKFEALYAFERQERKTDETLRQYDTFFDATFKFAGSYLLVNGRKFDDADGSATSSTTDDRKKIRGSGWEERSGSNVGRIYYGPSTLGDIEATSQPYYQLTAGGVPTDFAFAGEISEAVQIFGDSAVDPDSSNINATTYLSLKVRTFGNNYDEKLLADSGVAEMAGYSTGFALAESDHLTTGNYALADVYGGSQIAPWTGMSLEKLSSAQTESGFNEADGDFTWVLNNTGNGSLYECVAFLDALAQTDDDIDSGSVTVTNGKRVNTWYTYDANGRIVTRSGAGDGLGLFIENIPVADEQLVVFKADSGATKTRPFQVSVNVDCGASAVADSNAWYHWFYLANYNSASAVTVQNASGSDVKGNVASDVVGTEIQEAFDYDGDTLGGSAGTDKDVVALCEGNGGATQAKTIFTITRQTTVAATCAPSLETNI